MSGNLNTQQKIDTTPAPRTHIERIGDIQWSLNETILDVHNDVVLWDENPRLLPYVEAGEYKSEQELEESIRRTPGYDSLKKSIADIGQMEPIYVWKGPNSDKYIVFEGATRVSILRELDRKNPNGSKSQSFNRVTAKVLPAHFGEIERVILLAKIHVRGSGVRAWGRYIEAKFIWENVTDTADHTAKMNVTKLAQWMGKSTSWVQRLRDAYEFARRFVDYVDGPDAHKLAVETFSTLEEISKAPYVGSKLKEYDNPAYDTLRNDVFDMVRNRVFKEYRDARFLKEFHEDPDKWAQLKTGEKHIASRLAADIKHNSSSLKAKITGIEQAIERSIDRGEFTLDESDLSHLERAGSMISQQIHHGIRPFRIALKRMTESLSETSLADVKALEQREVDEFNEALEYFTALLQKHSRQNT